MVVYKATSPSGKVYIGISKYSLEVRVAQHLNDSKKDFKNRPFLKAIRKYGNLITWEILDTASNWETLCNLEKFYIEKFNSNNRKHGYNLTRGGEGGLGAKSGSENPMFGKPSHRRGLKPSVNTIEKLKQLWTLDKRNKFAITKGARPFRVFKIDIIKAVRSPQYVPRKIVDIEEVGTWICQTEACKFLGFKDTGHLNKCLKGIRKSYKGFRFEYA